TVTFCCASDLPTRVAKKNIEAIINNSDEGVIDEGFLTQIHTMLASSTGIVDMRGVSKMTKSYNSTHSLGGPGSSVTITTCKSYTKRQFFDINGDRYPDIITDYGLIYTGVNGAIKGWTMGIQGPVQKILSTNYNFGICPGSNSSQVESEQKGSGKVEKPKQSFPSLSFSLATGDNRSTVDYQDINGDGLPDRIKHSGMLYYAVQYNMGYSLSNDHIIENLYEIQHTKNKSSSLSVGYSTDKSKISGGLSILENRSEKMDIPLLNDDDRSTLLDINGDGLPDRIVEYNNGLKIYVNTGDGFVEYNKKSIGIMDTTKGRSWTLCFTIGEGIKILPPPLFIGTLIIDGGKSVTKDGNSTTYAL
ncbi:MAG TPA: VCBS repeat-containing protein, partial [Spirochaetota bacterium]|nr:VCBS repeat-containing protein [Spirochaetota bacterium]